MRGGDVEPHAVGADDADAGLHRAANDLRLQLRQLLLAGLAEAGGEEVDGADAFGDAVVYQGGDGAGGDAGDHVVDGALDLQEARVALQPLDLLVAGVDRVDGGAADVLEGDDEAGADTAEAGLRRRRAGDGDRTGAEQEIEAAARPGGGGFPAPGGRPRGLSGHRPPIVVAHTKRGPVGLAETSR